MYQIRDAFGADESAVSPVVGVILMVAVTVILSAVIATFVLDLGSGTQQNPSAGVTFDEADGEVTVQAISMDNADKLEIHVDGEPEATINGVGDIVSVPAGDVSIVGILDGNEAVIQTYEAESVSDSGSEVWSEPNEDAPSDLSSTLDATDGDGTEENPHVITNDHELQAMGADTGAHYVLGNNIDASGTSQWNGGDGFEPVGKAFTGSFDGQGYEITGLTIDRDFDYIGLFGVSAGQVENVGLVDANIAGRSYVGSIVGQNSGDLSNTYATGSVDGFGEQIGGLVGINHESPVSNSYSAVSVTGGDKVGGLVGKNSGDISGSYWDTETSGQDVAIGVSDSGTSTNNAGLTTSEMTGDSASSNMNGFDFDSTWETVDGDYPALQWESEE